MSGSRSRKPHRQDRAGTAHADAWLPRAAWLAPYLLIAAIAAVAYSNSLSGPFVFDDVDSVKDNLTVRDWSRALRPPPQTTVTGRPILNLTFAINYAISGLAVWSYHVFNLLIHIVTACGIYAVSRDTFRLLKDERFAQHAKGLALVISLLWVAHPLQTESVTYIVQRAESLVTLFYVWSLFCVIRVVSDRSAWTVPAVMLCALGMGSKEVMATAPFVILLYDRTFLAGSFREALRQRGRLHGLLWSTLSIAVMLHGRGRPGSAGFGEGRSWIEYANTQPGVLMHYIRLAVCPHPLVLDYQWPAASSLPGILLPGAVLLGLLTGTAVLVWKNRAVGFALAAFFVILAPSSSVIPIADRAAEHRMYLALAPLIMLIVAGTWAGLRMPTKQNRLRILQSAAAVSVVTFAAMTFARNRDYRSAIAIWQDTSTKRPQNPRAHYNLGTALELAGQPALAVEAYEKAIALKPDYADALGNAGLAYMNIGKPARAKELAERAVRARPNRAYAHSDLADILSRMGNADAAIAEYEEALRLDPNSAAAHFNLGNLHMQKGEAAKAAECYERAVAADPSLAQAHFNLGLWHQQQGDLERAAESYRSALRARPDYAKAREQLEQVVRQFGQSNIPSPGRQ